MLNLCGAGVMISEHLQGTPQMQPPKVRKFLVITVAASPNIWDSGRVLLTLLRLCIIRSPQWVSEFCTAWFLLIRVGWTGGIRTGPFVSVLWSWHFIGLPPGRPVVPFIFLRGSVRSPGWFVFPTACAFALACPARRGTAVSLILSRRIGANFTLSRFYGTGEDRGPA